MRRLPPTIATVLLLGCPSSEPETSSSDSESTTSGSTGVGVPTAGTSPTPTTSTGGVDSTGPGAGSDSTGSDDGGSDESSTGEGPDPFLFEFDPTPPSEYTQIDRMGFPTSNLGLNLFDDQDGPNALTPSEALAIPEPFLVAGRSLLGWHRGEPFNRTPGNTGLDDDFPGQMWTPCPLSGGEDCLEQVGPFLYPDTLRLVVGGEPGFPNGRQPQDPVMDYVLALMWLDVGVTPDFNGTEPVTRLLDLNEDGELGPSLNPLTNDVALESTFPYLAAPHEP